MRPHLKLILIAIVIAIPVSGLAILQRAGSARNNTTEPGDAIGELQRKIDSGKVKLEFDTERGYLQSLLSQLHIPVSSQSLVFSKSSFDLHLISPERPRALYFNDDVYIGWVNGADEIEAAAIDPKIGPVFYTLSQTNTPHAKFVQAPMVNCLVCHDFGVASEPVPRLLMLSVLPNPEGSAIGGDSLVTNDKSPMRERWGGWYVTGTYGAQRNLGNMVVHEPADSKIDIKNYAATHNLDSGANFTNLKSTIDVSPYLTPNSDIVALMVLGHQTQIHNLITFAEYRLKTAGPSPAAAAKAVADGAEALVQAMLFSGAAPLTSPVEGTTSFAADFSRGGPRDSKGRSLRELDLQTRLLRYPLSYLVYSASFDQMPAPIKQYVYRRFREILTGQDKSPAFANLSQTDRDAILQILTETKPDFAASK